MYIVYFHQSILRFVPVHYFSPSTPWFIKELKKKKLFKKKTHAKYKSTLYINDYSLFHLFGHVIRMSSKDVIVCMLTKLNC